MPVTARKTCLFLAGLLWLGGPAGAQEAQRAALAPKKAAAPAPDAAEALVPELRSKEGDAVEAAQKLAAVQGPRAVEVMLNELALGVQPKVAAALIEGLASRKDPRAIDVLSIYASSRSPELRRRAVVALGDIPDSRVVPLLIHALSDGSGEVRAAAAAALGARREKSAEQPLLRLLGRQDTAAPRALGLIGGPETARTLAEMVGNVPDRLVVQTLGELLKRPDFGPDPLRVEVVKTLGKIPGPDALDVLTDYVKAAAKDKARPSRAEASKIIEQRTAK